MKMLLVNKTGWRIQVFLDDKDISVFKVELTQIMLLLMQDFSELLLC